MDTAHIEQRMLAYLVAASKAKPPIEYDYYVMYASKLFNIEQHEVTPEQRKQAKAYAYRHLYRS